MLTRFTITPRRPAAELFRHVFREANARADELSKHPQDVQQHFPLVGMVEGLKIFFDASYTQEGSGRAGVHVMALQRSTWHVFFEASKYLGVGLLSSTHAEALALEICLEFVENLFMLMLYSPTAS